MQLTKFTDYALRVLIHLGERPGELGSIGGIAACHGISRNHLMKIVRHLGQVGLIETQRGRGGGIRLGRPTGEISLGEVVRTCEGRLDIAGCETCTAAPDCGVLPVFDRAMSSFLAVLDETSLADVIASAPQSGEH